MASDSVNLRGFVRIKKNDDLVFEGNNHIVLTGRHWLLQRTFNIAYSPTNDSQQNWLPLWFAIGSGGASNDNPFQNIFPTDEDINVYHPIPFLETTNAVVAPYANSYYKKRISSYSIDSYLSLKCVLDVGYEEAVDKHINEVGIFVAPTNLNTETSFVMLSHITFPTISKTNLDQLVFEWYYIF